MPKIVVAKKLSSESPAERQARVAAQDAERVAGIEANKAKLTKDIEALAPKIKSLEKQRAGVAKHPTLKQIAKATGTQPIAAVNMSRRGGGRYGVKFNASSDTEVAPDPALGYSGRYRGDTWFSKVKRGKAELDKVPDVRTHTGQPAPKPEPKYVRAPNVPSEPISDVKPAKKGEIHPGFVAPGPGETVGKVVKPGESKPPEPSPEHTGDIVANPNAGAIPHDTRIPSPKRPEPKAIMVAGPTNAPTERARFGPNKEIIPGRKPIGAKAELSTGGTKVSLPTSRPPSGFTSSSERDLKHGLKGPKAGARPVGVTQSASSLPFNLDKPEKKDESIGEEYMNPNKIANDIIREAFTSGPQNTTTGNTSMGTDGEDQRAMLAGEWLGSVAWPFQQATSKDFDKSNNLQNSQKKSGMGDGHGDGFQESLGKEIVDNLLEDSPSAIYSDPDSVGYLINELSESGYTEYAATITSICEDAKEEDVVKIADMIEKMEAEKADSFLIEQLSKFASLLIEDDSNSTSDKNPSDPNANKEDAASETDNNSEAPMEP